MNIVLAVLMALFFLKRLTKFALWLLVPYSIRIKRISSYYAREQRIIGVYDTVTLLCVVARSPHPGASGCAW
ncbi:hypothetical protein [Nonomuraea diastatica]|uniref:hypothetical protein n=1 Tax=Nonomuraea diastatica TaxID=1848329 RepID=UPI001C700938|nr:hypothetical protein [Nonomuraea diastatica]